MNGVYQGVCRLCVVCVECGVGVVWMDCLVCEVVQGVGVHSVCRVGVCDVCVSGVIQSVVCGVLDCLVRMV